MICYQYRCKKCGANICEYRDVNDRDLPNPCACGGKLKRLFCTNLLFTANRASDMIENRVYHGTKEEIREQQKRDDKRYDELTKDWDTSKPQHTTVGDILATGLHPNMTKEAVMNWREANIPKDDWDTSPHPADRTELVEEPVFDPNRPIGIAGG